MHWKIKAKIQNTISILPSSASYETYYWVQRHFGNLRRINPVSRMAAGIETWQRIKKHGCDPSGKVFLEVGTGRVPLVPLTYWLMGAAKTITIDLNPYLKGELITECLQYISNNNEKIQDIFGSLLNKRRMNDLLDFSRNTSFSTQAFLDLCQITYIAPGDAANTKLPPGSIDFHTSYTVFEHIPSQILVHILEEGNRIISDYGLFVHKIDYSDHFSHSDKNISKINLLQYSDEEWNYFAGNRYMYMNRLRHDDFTNLFASAGHRILEDNREVDQQSRDLLASGSLQLNERFDTKPTDILSVIGSWIVSQKKR